MDGPTVEHSDSDSGESWTLLENCSTYVVNEAENLDHSGKDDFPEKDDDTDGISIISDSDPESAPCELVYETHLPHNQGRPTDTHDQIPELPNSIQLPYNTPTNLNQSMRSDDDLLSDNTGRLKTYVHRRNKRLSTVLNIIVLGSVITAAGVAIGHMWGAKNDCIVHTTPSVNKILSNLYKLQEENAFLRNKLRELTFANNIHMQQRNSDAGKVQPKQQRCKKVFEESLNNKNVEKLTKCVDEDVHHTTHNILEGHLTEPDYEKEFLDDVNRLKNVYEQNKSWLDDEIVRRMKHESKIVRKIKKNTKKMEKLNKEEKKNNNQHIKSQMNTKTVEPLLSASQVDVLDAPLDQSVPDKIISYAESLKTQREIKKESQVISDLKDKDMPVKKKLVKRDYDTVSVLSEEESQKDNRHVFPKHKLERKKHDRQKLHKKQKRRNKYEQWEMKGGYMKDYDDFSISSMQDNDRKNTEKYAKPDNKRKIVMNKSVETDSKDPTSKSEKIMPRYENSRKTDDANWYDNRAALRTEARKKLDLELFGGKTLNSAGWYFRRMQKREQCRTKADNSTHRKFSKRNLNFKMKF